MLPTASNAPTAGRPAAAFAVDAWSPDYGTSLPAGDLEETSDDVDCSVETGAAQWQPITPPPHDSTPVAFVDGVRRTEARVWFPDGDTSTNAACASLAAGAVICPDDGTPARIVGALIDRAVYAPAGSAATEIVTTFGTYRLAEVADSRPEAVHNAITAAMTELEKRVAVADTGLVVYDGPLRGRNDARGVGYIKTQHVIYVPAAQAAVVAALEAGQRTPLFCIGDPDVHGRLSWYLRLPGPRTHPLAGVVRCELPHQVALPAAVDRAHLVSALLPRYASSPHRDARAPQNLTPIAGLENHLRHRLGDQLLLLRSLRAAAVRRPLGATP